MPLVTKLLKLSFTTLRNSIVKLYRNTVKFQLPRFYPTKAHTTTANDSISCTMYQFQVLNCEYSLFQPSRLYRNPTPGPLGLSHPSHRLPAMLSSSSPQPPSDPTQRLQTLHRGEKDVDARGARHATLRPAYDLAPYSPLGE